MPNETNCIILAAGQSRRFGSPKMEYCLHNDLSILENTINVYSRVFNNVSVVIRSEDRSLKKRLASYPIRLIESSNAEQGLSQSIAAGVQGITNRAGFLIALGDMPFIQATTLEMMKHESLREAPNKIILPFTNERPGNPVWFGADYRNDLLNLQGDIGAKLLIQANPNSVVKCEVNDSGIFRDIDTIEDLPSVL